MSNKGKPILYNTTELDRKEMTEGITKKEIFQMVGIVLEDDGKTATIQLFRKGLSPIDKENISEGAEEGQYQLV